MSIRHRIAVMLLVTFAVASVASASHSWGGYHWARTSNPFTLKVYDNVTSTWDTYVDQARVDWNQSAVLDLNVIWNTPLSSAKRCTSATGVIEVCNSTYGNTGWLGIAGIWASGGHITKGYTKLNDTYFNQTRYNTPAWRRMVTCQEIGHDFGLAHQDENFSNTNLGSCMDYTNDPSGTAGTNGNLNNEHPNSHDYSMIASIYNHNDSTTTIASLDEALRRMSTQASLPVHVESDDEGDEHPWQWGTPVRWNGNGRADLYVRQNHDGSEKITHVFWAPDVDPRGNPHHDDHDH